MASTTLHFQLSTLHFPFADIGVPLQIVNPLTSFGCGPTDRNSYVFAWTKAVIGRVSREAVANGLYKFTAMVPDDEETKRRAL